MRSVKSLFDLGIILAQAIPRIVLFSLGGNWYESPGSGVVRLVAGDIMDQSGAFHQSQVQEATDPV